MTAPTLPLAILDLDLTPEDALVRLARRELIHELPMRDCCLAHLIRTYALALTGASDSEVLQRFEELCAAVHLADGGWGHWSEVLGDEATGTNRDEQAADVAQALLQDTLAKLITPTGATP